jgi:hypothetical protein
VWGAGRGAWRQVHSPTVSDLRSVGLNSASMAEKLVHLEQARTRARAHTHTHTHMAEMLVRGVSRVHPAHVHVRSI